MIRQQTEKLVSITPPSAIVNNASYTCSAVDTLGFDYATVYLQLGATDIALTACKLQESDDNSTWSDVTGAVFGTSNNTGGSASTLPSATDDNKFFAVEVDLRGRKRYLKPVVTVGSGSTGAFAAIWAVLSRAEAQPKTAADRGCSQILRV